MVAGVRGVEVDAAIFEEESEAMVAAVVLEVAAVTLLDS